MARETTKTDSENRIRTTALRHAKEIEERKELQSRIADFVVEAFDLPSRPDANPAHPQPSDAAFFKQCLGLFQASDLDDLIYERNVDNRCGYALCPRPNQKLVHNGKKVWNKKGGRDFKLVDKAELEKWCSTACQERTSFVRAQLGTEPAWLREGQTLDIKLLDEVGTNNFVDSFKMLSISKADDEETAERLHALALERGELKVNNDTGPVSVVEKTSDQFPQPPGMNEQQQGVIEGHQPRKIRFSAV
ncbi:uncharacterized protein Z518_08306 [Rhinocladiella mackenziei CBS 650.93]|uniref:RNA polymerase II subunit B1 CTD phosphatase RPAP2 homolog n=1 Tax=Rhinocladiella mackenziei CBS 650.93 TaxID=1442369 RepID=A0A0D2J0F1_9EURO|nr:uncharacterized protein Z518_08306 [Rhinocladiella mackenziei CBS 650.93]KIX02365.1 hypothetical protein Z518_08306 [Rhinocladiella mackenziei CBS 650.93]